MKSLSYIFSTALALSSPILAQISLPNPQYTPPSASAGAVPSNSSSIPNSQWSTLLGNLLYFYDAQRSGTLPSTNRVPWRNNSCVDDGSDYNIDLSGGFFDAGDYIKATFPLAFTLMNICWGAMEYGKGYDLSKQTPYLDSTLRWGLDWMIKAHPSPDTLFVLVGDADTDNAYWGGDQGIPEPRPSFPINDTSPGTDVASQASAAFSACAAMYNGQTFNSPYSSVPSLQNATYASELLTHAQQLYSFAVNATGGQCLYQQSVPAVAAAYGSSSYEDDLTLATLFLAFATNSSSLMTQAQNYYSQFKLSGNDDVYNWDSKTAALAVLFSEVISVQPNLGGTLSQWQSEAERYFDDILDGKSRGFLTKGGLLWYDGDSDDSSLNPSLFASQLLSMYAPYATSSGKTASYINFATGQLNYALGDNPMNVPYVVGSNPNSPQNPSSAMASGGDDINNIDTSPPQEAYVLYGALVGGPDIHDRFFDIRSDWPETEPALDLNAPMLTLAALHVMNDTNDPFFTQLQAGAYQKPPGHPCDGAFSCHSGLSTGAKAAIGVVVSVVGLLLIGVAFFLLRRSRYGGKRFYKWSRVNVN